jgi:hypothetical protein
VEFSRAIHRGKWDDVLVFAFDEYYDGLRVDVVMDRDSMTSIQGALE